MKKRSIEKRRREYSRWDSPGGEFHRREFSRREENFPDTALF